MPLCKHRAQDGHKIWYLCNAWFHHRNHTTPVAEEQKINPGAYRCPGQVQKRRKIIYHISCVHGSCFLHGGGCWKSTLHRFCLLGGWKKYKKSIAPNGVFFHGDECHGIKSERKERKTHKEKQNACIHWLVLPRKHMFFEETNPSMSSRKELWEQKTAIAHMKTTSLTTTIFTPLNNISH